MPDGVTASSSEVGPGSQVGAAPILLIHGLGVDHRMWSIQAEALQDLSPVLAPDLPGFGREAPPPAGRCFAEAYADWLADWLTSRGCEAAHVAGYSMGGSLGLLLALRHPERVLSLAACCTSPCWGRRGRWLAARVFTGVGGLASMDLFEKSVLWAFSHYSHSPEERAAVEDMVARAHRPTMLTLYREFAGLDLRPRLGEISVPSLVVGGSRDWLAPPSHARLLVKGLARAEVRVLQGADHILCFGRAQEFSALLCRFFSSLPGRETGSGRPSMTEEA